MTPKQKPRVLVTGSSRGLGRAIAITLAKSGFDITVHCKEKRTLAEETLKAIKAADGTGCLLQFDVADREASRKTLLEELEARGPFYGVVLNAGLHDDGPFPGLSYEAWSSVVKTNLDGFYHVLHPLLMPMIQTRKGGRIVTMSSISGIMGNRGQVNYSAAKAGLIGATKALAQELAKRSITVNCIAPGLIEGETADQLSQEHREKILELIPMRRLGKPEEIAALVAFLFSEGAAYMTGQVLSANGGLI